jgi:toxin ParE1/3/4
MRVRYSRNARADLAEMFAYIAKDNPVAAAAVVRRVEEVVTRLALFPGTGHGSDVAGVRVVPMVRFSVFDPLCGRE